VRIIKSGVASSRRRGEQKKARMERERIDSSGARVWCPKNQVAPDSIPITRPTKRRGRDRLNQIVDEGENFVFI
jgi:hypothetical protein